MHLRLVVPVLDQIRERLSALLALQIRLYMVPQVLLVVGPCSNQLATHAARVVHLQHVSLLVVLQGPPVRERFVALLAVEAVGRHQMQFAVLGQPVLRHEAVHAPVALELGPTRHPVVLQRLAAHEHHRTDLALVEGTFAVNGRVVPQLALVEELLVALLAAVLGDRVVVQVAVLHEHVVRVEDGAAVRTRELATARVPIAYVVQQIRLVHKELATLVTVEAASRKRTLRLGLGGGGHIGPPFSRVPSSLVPMDLVHGAVVCGGEGFHTLVTGVALQVRMFPSELIEGRNSIQ